MRLEGKIALVTGGARGIGFAIAKAFAAEGAAPVIADINEQGARDAVAALQGSEGLALGVNVAEQASITAMIEVIIARYGRLDILVNNAGIGGNTPFLDIKLEEWSRTIAINLTGAFLVAQACAREMAKQQSGKIINIASLSGQRGGHGRAAYGSAKAGLELLTKVMACRACRVRHQRQRHSTRRHRDRDGEVRARSGDPRRLRLPDPDDALRHAGGDRGRGRVPVLRREPYVHGHTLNVDGGFRAAGLMFRGGKAPADLTSTDVASRRKPCQSHHPPPLAALAGGTASRRRCRCAMPTPPSTASRSAPTCRRPTRSTSTSPKRPSR
jgi:3-oxoacyl-[acyl-carrier protein] reductase